STDHGVQIFVVEFSCARWSGFPNTPNALNYLTDCISLFEENGWNWTYQIFRESGIWETEFSTSPCSDKCNPNCTEPFTDTDRKQLLVNEFSKNTPG
ncbi:MAG: hypothetical protein KDD60_04220, partial [Bdellovibrionales bacterium]|nr:hypothetical protein [Bdellovibrionales bacterium]